MSGGDRVLTCADCGREFVFTAQEQDEHAARGWRQEPKRCRECREAKRARMGGGKREFHVVVCSACGKEARVPFVPTPGREVFCDDCFRSRRSD